MSRQGLEVLEAFEDFGPPYLAATNIRLRIGLIVSLGDHPFAVAREVTWDELIAHHTKDMGDWVMDPLITPETHPYCYEFVTD